MAFRDVSANPDDFSDEPTEYPKFEVVGDKMAGVFVGTYESDGQYGKRKNYKFRGRLSDGVTVGFLVVTPSAHLARSFEGADLKPGYKVVVTLKGEKPMKGTDSSGQPKNPMKIFSVLVDDSKPGAAPAAAAKPAAKPPPPAPKPAAKPPPGDFDFDAADDVPI